MNVRIGIWAGGDPSNAEGTIQWAGGATDYSKTPFTMYIKDVTIVNYNPAESYTWSDQTGSYESIEFTGSKNSTSSSTTSKTTSASASGSVFISCSSVVAIPNCPGSTRSLITAANTATPSSSGSVSSRPSAPSASPVFNAASNLSAGSLGFLSILAVVSGFLFL